MTRRVNIYGLPWLLNKYRNMIEKALRDLPISQADIWLDPTFYWQMKDVPRKNLHRRNPR